MKRKISVKKAVLAASLLCILTGTVIAAIQYIHFITNEGSVIEVYGVKVVKDVEPYDIEITSIDWGNLPPGSTTSTLEIFGCQFRLKNQDNCDVWVWWRINPDTPLPEGLTLEAYLFDPYGNPGQWYDGMTGPSGPTFKHIPTGTMLAETLEWHLKVASETLPTAFSFTIDVLASDSPTG